MFEVFKIRKNEVGFDLYCRLLRDIIRRLGSNETITN